MATIDIGKLTFTHKGDYAGGTAYVANDVVYYNGSAYIAKTSTTGNLPTSTTHWNVFSAGSGGIWNSGLSLGSAGQSVKVNAAGNALEFGTISSDFVKLGQVSASSSASLALDGYFTSDYQRYEIHADNVIGSDNKDYYFRVYRGGSEVTGNEYISTSNYLYTDTTPSVQDGGHNSGSQDTDSPSNYFQLGGDDHLANMPSWFRVIIHDPLNTTHYKQLEFTTSLSGSTSGYVLMRQHGVGTVRNTAALSGFAFYPTSGNITSGTFKIYGIK